MHKKMIYVLITFILLPLLIGCSPANHSNQDLASDDRLLATLVRVVDGDTLIVKLDDQTEERVRLLLIDTPESVHPDKPVQPFGKEASEYVKSVVQEGSELMLELDIGERDSYGRLLAYVWVGDGMLNEQLLQKGYARVAYVFEPNTRHVDRFNEIQKEAQKQGIGIWSIEDYVQQRGFNEKSPNDENDTTCSNPLIKGNHSSNGDFIYHVPGSLHYDRTKGEEYFCTEEEAEMAGFRKASN